MEDSVRVRERAVSAGADKARLQHPVIDLTRCLGCATCVSSCPEEGVLELVHGQAVVVRGARCQGVAACARECPVGAITVTLADLSTRTDVPVISGSLEAVGTPGLFLAGEVTAHALIRTAIEHGTAVAAEVATRPRTTGSADTLDLLIVGAGPAGLACALEAKRLGLSFVVIEQELRTGGTVAKYPRRKLVVTQPVDLPLVGRLKQTSWTKEELVELWDRVTAEHALPIRYGARLESLDRDQDGSFVARTAQGDVTARNACLAIGSRGSPNKLGVPGEDLSKVAYSLIDAASYEARRVLVVGGGDSAVETALALAQQTGNTVTLSYRREAIMRATAANESRLTAAVADERIQVLYSSVVRAIDTHAVTLEIDGDPIELPNDDVFIMAGGAAPLDVLQAAGVSFDPSLRDATSAPGEEGTGLLRALGTGLVIALATLAWALWHLEYYALPADVRPTHPKHTFLRPGEGIGLVLGIGATVLIVINLAYLLRRSPRLPWFQFGSLRTWMTSHVATGVLAFFCAALHASMSARDNVGGHAFAALGVLLVTGAIGRYLYSYVPREANGRELELAEVRSRLTRLAEEWDDGQRRFRGRARDMVEGLVASQRWQGSFMGRFRALLLGTRDLRRAVKRLEREGRAEGLAEMQIQEALRLTRRAFRAAVAVNHYEELRAVASTWRYLHRWVALLMVVLVVVHVIYAVIYG